MDIASSGTEELETQAAELDISALRTALQERKRAVTMLRAEAAKELELREALQAQLVEANEEIVASWNRRKEISAVNANLRTKLSEVTAEAKQLRSEIKKLKAEVQTRHEELAAMQRYVVEASFSGKAKKLSRRAKGFVRKIFK